MEITNQWVQFYVPDEIGNNQTKTVADIFASAIPLALHNLQVELEEKQTELEWLDNIPDEELIQYAKDNMPELQEREVTQTRIDELNELISNYK